MLEENVTLTQIFITVLIPENLSSLCDKDQTADPKMLYSDYVHFH